MEKVYVDNIIDNCNYVLIDSLRNSYTVCMNFIDVDIRIGDILVLDKNILKEVNIYTFGKVEHHDLDKSDYIRVFRKDCEFLLERYYG